MQDEPDPRRHPRTVMATDTEWQRIRERRPRPPACPSRASSANGRRAPSGGRHPPSRRRPCSPGLERIETAVLVLAEIERQRLAERGEEDGWEAATRRVALRLRAERPVAGDAPS